ncbi:MAG: YicC family protein [Desulfobulbaceae bacterium]|nr:YicC family protein [Desulfobulbaceae bacterium]
MKRPLSMTSFGRGEHALASTSWTVEIRSVNHRYCDISLKLPRRYAALEERFRKEVAGYFSRGHIDVLLTFVSSGADSVSLAVNMELARQLHRSLATLSEELALAPPADLGLVASFRDVLTVTEPEEDLEAVWPAIRAALVEALDNGILMREREGAALKEDLLGRLAALSATAETIAAQAPELVRKKEMALKERLDNLLKGVDIDPARLAQEVAIMADKADVTEELVRLRSHCQQFSHFLEMDEPVGRRLDFLMQEFLREINTIASKISDASVAHLAVELKNEVEKMREQVQNLE